MSDYIKISDSVDFFIPASFIDWKVDRVNLEILFYYEGINDPFRVIFRSLKQLQDFHIDGEGFTVTTIS